MFGGMNGRGRIKMDVWEGMGTEMSGLCYNLEEVYFIDSVIILE
jgi:hypothetical protein